MKQRLWKLTRAALDRRAHVRVALAAASLALTSATVGAQQPLDLDRVEIERVADGYGITEGPIWHKDGYLLFVDVPGSRIYKYVPGRTPEVLREGSGRANAIGFAPNGDLIVTQRDRKVSRIDGAGAEVVLAERHDGKRLNSPNDLAVRSDGTIYFTDPTFGVRKEEAELGFKGVYRITPQGRLDLLANDFEMPNGIVFSPDGKRLYVNDSGRHHMRVFDVNADGTLSNSRIFAEMRDTTKKGDPDGLEIDARGNVYSAGPGGVWVFAPDGTLRGRVAIPEEHTTNLAWGDADGRTLYVTAVSSVNGKFVGRLYRLRARSR